MAVDVFRFCLGPSVPVEDAEMTLHLSIYAVEGLFGQARIRMDVSYYVDEARQIILVDATNEVGLTLVRVFTGLLLREFGENTFHVRRVDAGTAQHKEGRAA